MYLSGEQVIGKNKQFSPIDFLRRAEKLTTKYYPNEMMLKETSLSPEESEIVGMSLESGLQMLESVPDLEEIVSVLRFQYEHFDGCGLPSGFSHDQIPVHARIIAVANAYDSFTLPRTARAAMSHDEAIRTLRFEAGRRFDPNLVNIFCEIYASLPVIEEVDELVLM